MFAKISIFILIGALAGLALSSAGCVPRTELPRPNILYIMTDDHAAHMVSNYGSRIASTPNLDRIGNEGLRFVNAFCTNSLCAPSRFLTKARNRPGEWNCAATPVNFTKTNMG